MITEERMMVIQAVFAGQIGSEHVTLEELNQMQQNAEQVMMEFHMAEAEARGCVVFGGVECGELN